MTDYFLLLGMPRRPWLEPENVKERFFTVSAGLHPDRVHNLAQQERQVAHEQYVALNAANTCLSEPRTRLRHLLELERGTPSGDLQQVPSELINAFMEAGQASREVDGFLGQGKTVTSPVLKVQRFERAQEWSGRLEIIFQQLNSRRDSLIRELKDADAEWIALPDGADRSQLMARLDEIYRCLSFHDRWLNQIRERVARLAE